MANLVPRLTNPTDYSDDLDLSRVSTSPAKSVSSEKDEYFSKIRQIQIQFVNHASTLLKAIQDGEPIDEKKVQNLRLASDLSEMMRDHLKESAKVTLDLDHTQGEKTLQLAKQQADLQAYVQVKDIELKKAIQAIEHEQEKHTQTLKRIEAERRMKEEEALLNQDQELFKTVFEVIKNLQGTASLSSYQALAMHNFIYDAAKRKSGRTLRMIMASGISLNLTNLKSLTPLQRAVKEGNLIAAQILVEEGADPTFKIPKGRSLLHLAVRSGNVDMVRWVNTVTKKKLLETKDEQEQTPLFYAVSKGKVDIADVLMSLGATKFSTGNRNTDIPLLITQMITQNSTPQMIQWLFKHFQGGFLDYANFDGICPLQAAVAKGNLEFALLLVLHGADFKVLSKDGANLLHIAAEHGHIDIIEWLVELKLDLTARTAKDGYTPLMSALLKKQIVAAQKLLNKGSEVHLSDWHGNNLLHIAASTGSLEAVVWLLKPSHGLPLDSEAHNGTTPLHLAVAGGHIEIAQILQQCGAKLNSEDIDGNTVLHHAARSGSFDMLKWILGTVINLEINRINSYGVTSLAVAVSEGFIEGAKLLVSHGANPDTQCHNGNTLLHLVPLKNSERMFEWLLTFLRSNINKENYAGITPLGKAILSGNLLGATYLYSQKEIEKITQQNFSLSLKQASESGSNEMFAWVLNINGP